MKITSFTITIKFYHDGGWTFCRNRKPEKSFDVISKIKKNKEGQCEEKIIQTCVEEFDLNQEEVLTSLKKVLDDRMLLIVNKNNKNSNKINIKKQQWLFVEIYTLPSH